MVYVDMLINYGWKLGPSCHLLADSEDELHEFAAKIGMKRSWFQPAKVGAMPHYDLTAGKRMQAVKNGAKEIDRSELVQMLNDFWDTRQ